MKRGRGPAADTLSESEAAVVRNRLRQARDTLGLSNHDIAKILGWRGEKAADWTPQKVGRVFDSTGYAGRTKTDPRPLRVPKACTVFIALANATPAGSASAREASRLKARALELVNSAASVSRQLHVAWIRAMSRSAMAFPEALIPYGQERALAEFLVDRLAADDGNYSSARREKLIAALEATLLLHGRDLAESAAAVYGTRFRGWEQQRTKKAELLRAFGYSAKRRET